MTERVVECTSNPMWLSHSEARAGKPRPPAKGFIATLLTAVVLVPMAGAAAPPQGFTVAMLSAASVLLLLRLLRGQEPRRLIEALVEDVDLIAERAVQLGGTVEGTARSVAKRSTLAEYPVKTGTGRQHVDALSSALAAFGKAIRSAVDTSDRVGDDDTNDIFIEISRGVDKWLWMVEAHLAPNE